MKAFLREHSWIYNRIDPPARSVVVCRSCTDEVISVIQYSISKKIGDDVATVSPHAIGEVWIGEERLTKYCDGTEV